MKTILFLGFIGLMVIAGGTLWYRNSQNSKNKYPYADYAIVQPETNFAPRENIIFSFQDTQTSYKMNVDNVAYSPETQEALLEGMVIESSDPALPTGSHIYIYLQGTQDFWQNFPSMTPS